MNLDFKKTAVASSVGWERIFRLVSVFKKIFLVLSLLSLLGMFFHLRLIVCLGYFLVFFSLFLICFLKQSFFELKVKKPDVPFTVSQALVRSNNFNPGELLSFEAAKAFLAARGNSNRLLYSLLLSQRMNFVFFRLLIDIKGLRGKVKGLDLKSASSDFENIIFEALKKAKSRAHQRIESGDLLLVLASENQFFKSFLFDLKIEVSDLENVINWLEYIEAKIALGKRFWEKENLIKKGTLAKDWSSGYTPLLDRFGVDYSEVVKKQGFPEMIGHKKEMEIIERVLSRRELNNCLLVGEPGVGKRSLVLELAKRSVLGTSLPEVNHKRIVQLDLSLLANQTKSVEEAELVMGQILDEALAAGNIILVIDEFHNFVIGEKKPGLIDISGVLGPFLPVPTFQLVALTDFSGLHKNIEQKPLLLSMFEKVELKEISEKEALIILENHVLLLEHKYKKFIGFPTLKEAIALSKKYISKPLPKSAIDLLDEVVVKVVSSRNKVVLPKDIRELVVEKTDVPVGDMEGKEKDILLNLENLIHQRIINQEEGVREVSAALRRARAEVSARKGPMGTFLFLGPTGVGKTETAKALAEIYFGSEQKMIRLDMSEFQAVADIPRLIGAPGQEGMLTTKVKENPFSLVLLDEIEKSHPNILNLFLQVLDEGFLTDGSGVKIDFKNFIIIATSNAGYQIILEAIKQNYEWSGVKQRILDYLFQQGTFRPEFVNRFDALVIFRPLTKENLLLIAELLLRKVKEKMMEKGIDFNVSLELKEKIVSLGYDPVFGARQMKRVIQDKVEDALASALLSGKISRRDKIIVDPETFEVRKI